jgi:hypothetical protein
MPNDNFVLPPLASKYIEAIWEDFKSRSNIRNNKNYIEDARRARENLVNIRKEVKKIYNIHTFSEEEENE